jgi:hypothetical protein
MKYGVGTCSLWTAVVCLGLGIAGCSGGSSVEVLGDDPPDGPKRADVLNADDFSFSFAEGGWIALNGFDALVVNAQGEAAYGFLEEGVFRKLRFTVAPQTLTSLRKLLADGGFLSLNRRYANEKIMDGTQRALRLDAGGVSKVVNCMNDFPPPVRQLTRFVHAEILAAKQGDRAKGEKIEREAFLQMVFGAGAR